MRIRTRKCFRAIDAARSALLGSEKKKKKKKEEKKMYRQQCNRPCFQCSPTSCWGSLLLLGY